MTTADYGWEHQQLRARWKPKVDAGLVNCARCKTRIVADAKKFGDGWQLDHDPSDPTRKRYLGPSHTGCNQGGGPPLDLNPEPTPHTDWS